VKIIPLRDQILIEKIYPDDARYPREFSSDNIVVTFGTEDRALRDCFFAEVIAVGEGTECCNETVSLRHTPGDVVIVEQKAARHAIEPADGPTYFLISDYDILARVEL